MTSQLIHIILFLQILLGKYAIAFYLINNLGIDGKNIWLVPCVYAFYTDGCCVYVKHKLNKVFVHISIDGCQCFSHKDF